MMIIIIAPKGWQQFAKTLPESEVQPTFQLGRILGPQPDDYQEGSQGTKQA